MDKKNSLFHRNTFPLKPLGNRHGKSVMFLDLKQTELCFLISFREMDRFPDFFQEIASERVLHDLGQQIGRQIQIFMRLRDQNPI